MTLLSKSVSEWLEIQKSKSVAAKNIFSLLETVHKSGTKINQPEWIYLATKEDIQQQVDLLPDLPTSDYPLYGVPFAVKDNIDVAEMPTTAACPTFKYTPPEDARIVKILKSKGAVVLGKTNLDQFATGLVGTRSPYGIPTCVYSKDHVSGGSSSGSAVVVAKGIVPFSLGTDTAGSGRVPAALNNLVGVKPTVGAWSSTGVVPACKSLDTVSLFTTNLEDAQLVFQLGIKFDQSNIYSRKFPARPHVLLPARPVVGVPTQLEFFGDSENQELFNKFVAKLVDSGNEIRYIDCTCFYELARLLYEGPWVAERTWAIQNHINKHGISSLDPTVAKIVSGGFNISAVDCFDKEYKRQELKAKIADVMNQLDLMVVPTCPLNPKVEDVLKNPIEINSKQGFYTNFVNLADLSALAIPNTFRSDGLPVGVTLLGKSFQDLFLINFAHTIGNNDVGKAPMISDTEYIDLAVVGAHLSGMPLNWQLRKVDAVFVKCAKTSPNYRLYALKTTPPKPGIKRDDTSPKDTTSCTPFGNNNNSPTEIDVEIWKVPLTKFGEFVAQIPAPLGIGKLELEDHTTVSSFIWDGSGSIDHEITHYKGWKNYVSQNNIGKPFTKVLVANRGEIAVRIIKTLKKMNIKSVAVYSSVDKNSLHVKLADESIPLDNGEKCSATPYISMRRILDAAAKTCAEAIIPGYGFLSENADFADLCEQSGFIFVGPSGNAMRQLGLKHSARKIAANAGVPLVPGTQLLETVEDAINEVENVGGFPVMLKSTAGGGGIGLQRVDTLKELKSAYHTVRHQGEIYFGDSGVFMESFVENSRHVEVQVFGDGFGHAVALGVRDCSLQRRNQKIIEETPAPNVPSTTLQQLNDCGAALAASMNYKGAATVEFIYDSGRNKFYFLEVNARLQVEHPITEMVTGLDLVEWMLLVASNRAPFTKGTVIEPHGCAMEARLYAENPAKDFRPSPGQITELEFPKDARIDTWVEKGMVISSEYDPTVAKIIVKGQTRDETLEKLKTAIEETKVSGIITNKDYLLTVSQSEMFKSVKMHTKILDSFVYTPSVFEVLAPGSNTTIQDYPGRVHYWRIGVPPSGPMDSFSHRMANKLVGNKPDCAAIEVTLNGPSLLFYVDRFVSVTGGVADVYVDDSRVSQWTSFVVPAKSKLTIGKITKGCRVYIAINGGLDTPVYLNSRSTFAQGSIGGFNGRALKYGDVINLFPKSDDKDHTMSLPTNLIPQFTKTWDLHVTLGPHDSAEFVDHEFIKEFFTSEWKVHYNSNRFGVRLTGPKPKWTRTDGGEAGLHPSNAHDYVYSPGAINFTGDEPVIVGCDGPSLGGFLCLSVIIEADLWKVGQLVPGDKIRFIPVTYNEARSLNNLVENMIERFEPPQIALDKHETSSQTAFDANGILYLQNTDVLFAIRQAGDRYVLVEYGENVMDLSVRYRIHLLIEAVSKEQGVVECSPGVRSVHIEFNPHILSQSSLVAKLASLESDLQVQSNWKVESRTIHLPVAFEDSQTLRAVSRYAETIREEAPWLPNNVDFIASLNNIDRHDVRQLLYSATFMVMGLGDVYLGAPCAVPLDPRHRLLGTKYNPSRSWTPNGCVGLGGMYMCIYTMESPGGYQLLGRTIPIWDKLCLNQYSQDGEPWLLKPFDLIQFYPVSELELETQIENVNKGDFKLRAEHTVFDFSEYKQFLKAESKSIDEHNLKISKQMDKFSEIVALSDRDATTSVAAPPDLTSYGENAIMVYAEITGRFWKAIVSEGTEISPGDPLVVLEAMKTEMSIMAPSSIKKGGKVSKIIHKNGDLVETGDIVAIIEC